MEIEIVPYRIGTGYDVHKLVENRKLVLGGETIPFEKGLIGHSDADVLTHAIMDALLGAMAQGSIGDHFPDTDKKYKNINSIDLLERVRIIMEEEGYIVSNVDSTVICDRPKLAPYIENMRMNLSHALRVPIGRVSVKATTTEGLGFTGTEEGIAAQAVCLLIKDDFEEAEKASKKKSAEKKPVKKKEKEAMPVLPEITPGSIDKCVVYTDGATDINPGPSGIGLVFEYPDGKVFAKYAEFIGDGTNNQAEYKAALAAAEICLKWKIKEVEFRTDSDLMANQVNGRWKVKNEDLAILLMKLREYLGGLKKWRMVYVPREKNTAADKLSKLALQSEQG